MIADTDILQAKLLIVDDLEANVMLLEQTLADSGYTQVSSTMRPQDVCAMHNQHHYDLILLDLQMPGMDGFQVMEGLKTDPQDNYLPVLVITAEPNHKLRALRMGVRDFISKPLDLTEARMRIRNTLEVQLLYKQLQVYSTDLERQVLARTTELRESEARFRSLAELASDWYWEQDETGTFSKVSGPVLEVLGVQAGADPGQPVEDHGAGWNAQQRAALHAHILAREPFLDLVFSRTRIDGTLQQFRVSGEPMFNRSSRYIGYRGVGVEIPGNGSRSSLMGPTP